MTQRRQQEIALLYLGMRIRKAKMSREQLRRAAGEWAERIKEFGVETSLAMLLDLAQKLQGGWRFSPPSDQQLQVAYACVLHDVRRQEIKIERSSMGRDIKNACTNLGVSVEEGFEFVRTLLHELVDLELYSQKPRT